MICVVFVYDMRGLTSLVNHVSNLGWKHAIPKFVIDFLLLSFWKLELLGDIRSSGLLTRRELLADVQGPTVCPETSVIKYQYTPPNRRAKASITPRRKPELTHCSNSLNLGHCGFLRILPNHSYLQRRERINSLAAGLGKSTTLRESFPLHTLLLKFLMFKVLISFASNCPPGFSYF